jgi:hypothetical protein
MKRAPKDKLEEFKDQLDPFKEMELKNQLSRLQSRRRIWVQHFAPSLELKPLLILLVIGGGLGVWRLDS